MMQKIMACIDGSNYSLAVCDGAAWASLQLETPLTFVHVISKGASHIQQDSSGQIGLGAREKLLEELVALDEQRGRLAQEQSRLMLEVATDRAIEAGLPTTTARQRNGDLVESLTELEQESRLLVLGKRGETATAASEHLGSNLERAIRALHCPILIVMKTFTAPKRALIAFDGSPTAEKAVRKLALSPLLAGLEYHILFVGENTEAHRRTLAGAQQILKAGGREARAEIRSGEVEATLQAYQQEYDIDLLVMGAYGHSRIRHLLVGSTTTAMIRHAAFPILLIR
jgi:nucleotide-binding universal stress UspA family protein